LGEVLFILTTLFGRLGFAMPMIDLPPHIRTSPTLQKWLQQAPDVRREIANDPSFRTRLRVGYGLSNPGASSGVVFGVEDLRIGQTPIALSAHGNTGGTVTSWGVDAQAYVLPLGGYVNVAPVVGWRSIATATAQSQGLHVGGKVMLVPSRGGGTDLSLQQTWVNLGTSQEVGIGKFSVGYAITPKLRLATDLERWQGRSIFETRATVLLEWMP
jgi:hypothetical protein